MPKARSKDDGHYKYERCRETVRILCSLGLQQLRKLGEGLGSCLICMANPFSDDTGDTDMYRLLLQAR